MAGTASAEDSVKLCGYVTEDNNSNPVSDCLISVNYSDQNGSFFKSTQTDKDGYYELTVPYYPSYDFFVESRHIGGDNLYDYIPRKKSIQIGQSTVIQTDFILKPAANVIINAYDNNGNMLRNKAFREVTIGEVFATNPDGLPHYAVYQPIQDSYSESLPPDIFLDMTMPAFVILPQTPYKIHFLWEVPEFGKVMLFADNEGKGYSVENKGGQLTLNLIYEAAKSKLAMFERDLDLLASQGYIISDSIVEGLEKSREHLGMAETQLQNSNTVMGNVIKELNLSLKYALFAHEQLYLDKAKFDIEKNRKGDVNIKVVDEEGKALNDCDISYEQTSHDFIFSAIPDSLDYSELLKECGINATAVFCGKYGEIEPEPGHFNWGFPDSQVATQVKRNLTSIGNLGWFFFSGWGDDSYNYLPGYLKDMSFEEVKAAVYNHVYAIAQRYVDDIDIWDAIYEECAPWSNELGWTWSQKLEILKTVTNAVKDANPQAKILLMDEAKAYNHFMSWSVHEPMNLQAKVDWVSLQEFITVAGSHQIPIDIIGLYLPTGDVELYQTGEPNIFPILDFVSLSGLLDEYASFDKSIMVMGYNAPSTQIAGGCWWHRPWDEQIQAEYVTGVYSIIFSNALAKGIEWGPAVTDDVSEKYGGLTCGLLGSDLRPKPVYFALKNLINSWTTSGTGKTDESGHFEFRGFAGDYKVTLKTTNGRSFETLIHVNEKQTNEITINFPPAIHQETNPILSPEPEMTSPKTEPLPEESQLAATTPIEEAPPSERNSIPLIAGSIGGVVVLGLLSLFVVKKRAHQKK
jgi:hypothetical protein